MNGHSFVFFYFSKSFYGFCYVMPLVYSEYVFHRFACSFKDIFTNFTDIIFSSIGVIGIVDCVGKYFCRILFYEWMMFADRIYKSYLSMFNSVAIFCLHFLCYFPNFEMSFLYNILTSLLKDVILSNDDFVVI